ncbi:hormone receptor 4, partial [Trichonephila clavata]
QHKPCLPSTASPRRRSLLPSGRPVPSPALRARTKILPFTRGLLRLSPRTRRPSTYALPLHPREGVPREDDGQPMVCMICEDRATGLHYGIITCEGCKGFFKRTVQNKRVYTCVADGNCEVTKAQRNRCQYCRFQKCVRQGMVLAAVREDRMPGGRNSGAVYNLYKVKYKKHRRGQKNGI